MNKCLGILPSPPSSNMKTLRPTKETRLGQLINLRKRNINTNDPREEVGDPEEYVEPSNEENPKQDPFQETYINLL